MWIALSPHILLTENAKVQNLGSLLSVKGSDEPPCFMYSEYLSNSILLSCLLPGCLPPIPPSLADPLGLAASQAEREQGRAGIVGLDLLRLHDCRDHKVGSLANWPTTAFYFILDHHFSPKYRRAWYAFQYPSGIIFYMYSSCEGASAASFPCPWLSYINIKGHGYMCVDRFC